VKLVAEVVDELDRAADRHAGADARSEELCSLGIHDRRIGLRHPVLDPSTGTGGATSNTRAGRRSLSNFDG
jgi:hypothetical protein